MNGFLRKKLPAALLALALTLSLAPSVGAVEPLPPVTHRYDTVWARDEANHWHACVDMGCVAKGDFEPHSYGEISVTRPATCFQPGEGTRDCRCGFRKTEAIPATGKHSAGTDWKYDASSHWHGCTATAGCPEKMMNTAHSSTSSAYTTNSSTHWQVCDVCRGEFNKSNHVDADSNGACDRCGYAMPVSGLTVTFRNGSGTYSSQTVVKGKTPTNPGTPGKSSGYTFRGWSTSDPGSTATYRGQSYFSAAQVTSTAVNSNITYYAIYTAAVSGQDVSLMLDGTEGLNANSSTNHSSSLRSQMSSCFTTATGGSLRYVRFGSSSGSGYGRLYQDSDQNSLSTNRDYYYSSSSYGTYPLSSVYFLPGEGRGTYYISYAGYDEYGNSASGTASFIVGESKASTTITYTAKPGGEVEFDADDFNAAYQTEHSGNLRYVVFDSASSLTSSNGTLYFDYGSSNEKAFSKNTVGDYKFYYSSSSYGDYDLSEVSFLASSDFNTTLTLGFRAYYSSSKYVDGTVKIQSSKTSSSGSNIVYTVKPGGEVDFDSDDFNRVYQEEYSGSMRYVVFETASTLVSSNGVLYYDYGGRGEQSFTKSSIDDSSFYYSSSSYGDYDLDELTFVASSDFDSIVKLSFRAYYSTSKYVDGTVEIHSGNAKKDGDIAYTVKSGEEVEFDAEDFNKLYRTDYSGDMRYVVFDTASSLTSSNGVLYSNYDGKSEKAFSKSTINDYKFYYDNDSYGDYDLNDLSFVAKDEFDATVTLSFRAYYSTSKYVDGTLTIKPTGSTGTNGGDILYHTAYSDNVQINANDLARFFNKSYPDETLNYVKLTHVPTGGNLYYNYYNSSKYGTTSSLKLTEGNCDSQALYFSPTTSQYALSELTYVPSGVNYCARIPFTAYGSNSHSLSGAILISVNVTAVADVYGVVPKGTAVNLPASAIYGAVAASSGTTLASIQLISLPNSTSGTVYVGSGTSVKADTSTKYGYTTGAERMNQLYFVAAKNFTGSVEIPYVAFNASGNAIASGKFCLGVVTAAAKYSDISSSTWCYKYVTELSDAKVISGYKDKSFRLNGKVTYGEALKLILLATGSPVQTPTSAHWASGYLTKAKASGLISGNVNLDAAITRLAVSQLAAKAMKLSTNGLSSVNPFTDTNDLYVQALNAAGIVEGYFLKGKSTFKPGETLTRGQVSAIVWRMERV